jgi:hypothetical protein
VNQSDNERKITGRDAAGRFTHGNAGRPLGAKGKISRETLETVKSMKDGALQGLFTAIGRGERWAVEFVLSKVLPENRTIELEGMSPEDIRAALNAGDISPDEAKALANVAKNLGEMDMLEAIHARVKELEDALHDTA